MTEEVEILGKDTFDKMTEIHQQEIWALKQQLGAALEENTVLKGAKELVNESQRTIRNYKKRYEEAEGELSIIKATTVHNSPEMRDAKERITELEHINDSHQKLNGDLRREITAIEQEKLELHADNKKLAQQIEASLDRLRKSGM